MAFPVTLNGRTYTLADFEGTNYVDGLPDAFEDFVTQAGDIYNSTSTSSVAIGTGSKTFTTADSGKPYQAGTPLRIADAAAPSTNFMDCIVTSYSGTTLVVDVVGTAGSGTKSSWTINIGGTILASGGTFVGDSLSVSGTATVGGDLVVDTDTLFVDVSTDRVGIGTSSPATNLHVSDATEAQIYLSDTGGAGATSANSQLVFTHGAGNTNNAYIGNDQNVVTGAFSMGTLVNYPMSFVINSSEVMRLTTSGYVGIGTDSPSDLLHIEAATPIVRLSETDETAYSRIFQSAGDVFIASDVGNDGGSSIIFRNGGTTERARVDANGNVGIGTDDPVSHQTNGGVSVVAASDSAAEFVAFNNDAQFVGDFCGAYLFGMTDDGGTTKKYGGMWALRTGSIGEFYLGLGASLNSYENQIPDLSIQETGNVGIGMGGLSAARKLHVKDTMRLEPRATAPSSPSAGDIFFNSTTSKLQCYDGTAWQDCF